jgi:threonine/homoserine/homoserine lactone efflux protein
MDSTVLALLIKILGIHILAVSTPGPDFLLILKNTLKYNKKTSYFSALGIATGLIIHLTYAIFGLKYLTKNSFAANSIQILGACYLFYLSFSIAKDFIFNKSKFIELNIRKNQTMITPFQAFKMGFITNALNVKATMFFLSIFTGLFTKGESVQLQMLIGLILIIVTFFIFSLLANLFSLSGFKNNYLKFQKIVDCVLSFAFLFLGIQILLAI